MLLELPKWRRSGGRDFVFYHSHPGFAWGSEGETSEFLGTLCGALQWATMLVAENGQRWQCASFNPRRAPTSPCFLTCHARLCLEEGLEVPLLVHEHE